MTETTQTTGSRTRIVNLTPHPLAIMTPRGTIEIAPEATVARVETHTEARPDLLIAGFEAPVECVSLATGDVHNLPEAEPNTVYVVSSIVATAVPHRSDVATPHDLIRDDAGFVTGCRSLAFRSPQT